MGLGEGEWKKRRRRGRVGRAVGAMETGEGTRRTKRRGDWKREAKALGRWVVRMRTEEGAGRWRLEREAWQRAVGGRWIPEREEAVWRGMG